MSGRKMEALEGAIAREITRAKKLTFRELGKIEDELRDALGILERSFKKNPRKTALTMLSFGAAIGAASALCLKRKRKGK